ncbi:MAG: HAMP domain-containing histidine kinase [Anaerolineae bacterium]|nr:HAMP domain-containing histidine kinase [Anaerolineae bacterium]
MTLRLLFWSALYLLLWWGLLPALLTIPEVTIRADGELAALWFWITIVVLWSAAFHWGYGGRARFLRWLAWVMVITLLIPFTRAPFPLIRLQSISEIGLIWVLSAMAASMLWFAFLGKRVRYAVDQQLLTQTVLTLADQELTEGILLYDARLRLKWANDAGRRYLLTDKGDLSPVIARLLQRARETNRIALQSYGVDEGLRVNLQAAPLPNGEISVIAYPAQMGDAQSQFYERFIRRIIHDMRNPLAAIIAHANNLQQSDQLDAASVQTIEHEAQRLTRLVDSILFDARLSYIPLALEPLDLLDIAEEVYYQHDERAIRDQKTIQLEALTASAPFEGDRDLLVRALSNLVDNSLKYGATHVQITLEANDQLYALKVIDNGEGIPPEFLPDRLFEPLVRVRAKGGGSGLGLSMVKKIVSLHNGTITAHSTLGKGSTFTLCLPKP